MSSPRDKGTPEDAQKVRERAEYEHAMAVVSYDKTLTDGVAALCADGAMERLAVEHPEDYERLRARMYSFEAEMLNEDAHAG